MPYTLTLKQKKARGGQIYYPLQLNVVPKPSPGPREVLVKLEAAALNHRDFFLRQNLYPGLSFKSVMHSDGCGTVVELGPDCSLTTRDLVDRKVILKPGGVIVCYGMTFGPLMDWPMQAAPKNVELKGTMVGSRSEFRDMVMFIIDKQIKPVISRTVKGLDFVDAIDGLFEDIRVGGQFGKLVVEI